MKTAEIKCKPTGLTLLLLNEKNKLIIQLKLEEGKNTSQETSTTKWTAKKENPCIEYIIRKDGLWAKINTIGVMAQRMHSDTEIS